MIVTGGRFGEDIPPAEDEKPYEQLLAAYMAAWVEDIALCLLARPLAIGRLQRFDTAARAIAGYYGLYADPLVELAGAVLGYNLEDMWALLFRRGVLRARGLLNGND